MLKLLQKFVREEDGLEMVEWAIVAVLLTTTAAIILTAIGAQLNATLTRVRLSLLP